MTQRTIRPSDKFVCPKTKEKMDIETCMQRYVTANSLGKEFRLCVDCPHGKKNRAQLAALIDEPDEPSVKRYKGREKVEIERRVRYINFPLW